ncbi:MAG: hypothetical protein JOZ88_10510 [Hyphomicrobiales bacterium]|nr:hypothetical protein [Hyphomicrobiales bacterium]
MPVIGNPLVELIVHVLLPAASSSAFVPPLFAVTVPTRRLVALAVMSTA